MTTSIFSSYLLYFSTISLGWGFVVGLFILSLILISFAYFLGNWQKKQQKEITVESGEVKEKEITETKVESDVAKVKANHKRPILNTIAFVFITFFILSVGFLIGRYSQTNSNANNISRPFDFTNLVIVKGKKFSNEKVILDGYQYEDCTFTNCTFVYNGTAGFGFQHNNVNGSYIVFSENPAVNGTFILMKGLGYMKSDIPLRGDDEEPVKGIESIKTIQPPQN